ncbi:MAG: hypothetical protein U0V48_01200 [Anaerolineales bacterium]
MFPAHARLRGVGHLPRHEELRPRAEVFVLCGYAWIADRHRFAVHRSPDAFKAGLASNSAAYFGTQGELYDATAQPGVDAFASTPLTGSSFGLIMLTLPYLVSSTLAQLGRDVVWRSAAARPITSAILPDMAWALVITTALGNLFFLGVAKTIGWDFYVQANAAWWNYAWGYVTEAPPLLCGPTRRCWLSSSPITASFKSLCCC